MNKFKKWLLFYLIKDFVVESGYSCSSLLEYKHLFKHMIKIHRNMFTEENVPTTKSCFQESLDNAIMEISK
jgi:hypothetical protein